MDKQPEMYDIDPKLKLFSMVGYVLFGIVVLWITFFTAQAKATRQDDCNEIFEYTKSSDFEDNRVDIDFENSDQQIDVSAKPGYQITEVALEVPDDGFPGFHVYATGELQNFNPPGSHDINVVKVKVKKVCPDLTPTPSPTPTVIPTPTLTPTLTPTETPTPTPTIDPCSTDQAWGELQFLNCLTLTPTQGPTPIPTAQARQADPWDCSKDHSCKQGSTAPQCTDLAPTKLPENFHIYRKRGDAIAKWTPTEGNKAHIYFENIHDSKDKHALGNITNDGYEDNLHLLGSKDWRFCLQQAIGCAGGPIVCVDDGPTNIWRLFR